MIVAGIDPGITGAIAIFRDGRLDQLHDMPGYDGRTDAHELSVLLADVAVMGQGVYLEDTHAMPKNGTIANFKLGLNSGIVIGVVTAMGIPLIRVSVAKWRSAVGLRGKHGKDASLGLARELFPLHRDQLRLASHHNRAEAALIGRYGVFNQIHQQQEAL